MAIRIRHDAAAVIPPSNNTTRKYGQSLVMQQQQQKYATQQAQQDRMFDAYKMESQNIAQQQRDWQQRDFVLNRDRDQNKLQQQQMDAARQQQFMDEARKMESGMIMKDIQDGLYDTNTARELQQTLALEAEALGNPQYDATQRAEALQKIRARRALLAANRMEKPPAPTDQDRIDSLPVMDGVRYGKDKDGNPVPVMVMDEETGAWKPYEKPSSSRSSGQKGAKGDSGASQRPVTFEEYYGADEDKFQEALNAELQTMQDNFVPDPEGTKKMPTREDALNKMRDDYDFRQKALGRAQYGEPTLAPTQGTSRSSGIQPATIAPPSLDVLPSQSAQPGEMRSIIEQQPDMSQMENPLPSQYAAPAAPSRPTPPGYQWVTPSDGSKPFLYHPGPNNTPIDQPLTSPGQPTPAGPTPGDPYMPKEVYDQMVNSQGTGRQPYEVPKRTGTEWKDIVSPPANPQPATTQPGVGSNDVDMGAVDKNGRIIKTDKATTAKQNPPQATQQPSAPDFGALAAKSNGANKQAIVAIQNIYQGQTPDVQAAISVLLDDNSQTTDAAKALAYLQSKGIDIRSLTAKSKPDTQYRALGAGGR